MNQMRQWNHWTKGGYHKDKKFYIIFCNSGKNGGPLNLSIL